MRFSRGHSISHPLPIEPASNQTPRSQSSGPGTHSMLAAVCRSRKDWPGAAHPDVAAFGTEAPPPTEITALGAPQLKKRHGEGGFVGRDLAATGKKAWGRAALEGHGPRLRSAGCGLRVQGLATSPKEPLPQGALATRVAFLQRAPPLPSLSARQVVTWSKPGGQA